MSNNNNDYLLLSLFNDMYNNNTRTIDSLIEQNNNIRNNIMEIHRNNRRNYFPLNTRQNTRSALFNNFIPYIRTNNSQNNNSQNNNDIINNNLNDASNNRIPFIFTYSTVLPNNNFFDSVNITPNNQQIDNATRNLMYCDIMNPVNTSCPISLEPFNDSSRVTVIRHCRHIFNTESLINWFRTNCRCPVCRYDIRDYNSQTDEHNSQTGEHNSQTGEHNDETTETNELPITNNTIPVNTNTTSVNSNTNSTPIANNTNSIPLADFTFTFNTTDGLPQFNDTQITSLITELFNNYRRRQ
jgi:hypothetical protein